MEDKLKITLIAIPATYLGLISANYIGFQYEIYQANKKIINYKNNIELKEEWANYKESCLEGIAVPKIFQPLNILFNSQKKPKTIEHTHYSKNL